LEGTKNPAVTMNVMGHTNPKMMMRYQHPEYTQAARQAINRRNLRNGLGQILDQLKNQGAPASA
jgi:hypothetical protein